MKTMNVGELRAVLENFPAEMEVAIEFVEMRSRHAARIAELAATAVIRNLGYESAAEQAQVKPDPSWDGVLSVRPEKAFRRGSEVDVLLISSETSA